MNKHAAQAVFLSYASQDVETARRLADALRAFGVEVWFDQQELRGGDAWDQKIRKQIHDCTLFVPLISNTTQHRGEGYFRREWRLAVDRTQDLAEGMPFIVPVVVDEIAENTAAVPEQFLQVQWTRLPRGVPSPQFVEQVKRLLDAPRTPIPVLRRAGPHALPRSAVGSLPAATPSAAANSGRPNGGIGHAESGGVPGPATSRAPRLRYATAFLIFAIVLAGGIGWWLQRDRATPPNSGKAAARITSLAVKPLDDFSGDKSQSHLSDGMTEALCSTLGSLSALRVPGRASVMRFKGGHKSIQEMARELNVDAIVEGSVQRVGDRIRVTVQLIEAATDRHVWSQSFDRDFGDFLVVQDEVARAIAAEVRVRLTPEDQAHLTRARPVKREAMEAYLLGMHHWWQYSEENVALALRYFQQAIKADSSYASAHAGLALAYVQGGSWVPYMDAREAMPLGKAAAQRALDLDPMLAEAYVAMGYVRFNFDWDWVGADRDFKKAIELSPRSVLTLNSHAAVLVPRGDIAQAVTVLNEALKLDPLSAVNHSDLAWAYWVGRQYDRAIPLYSRALEMDPRLDGVARNLGLSYALTGDLARGREFFARAVAMKRDSPGNLGAQGWFHGLSGNSAAALEILAELDQLSKKRFVPTSTRVLVFLGLGQKQNVFDWLEKACDERDGWVISFVSEPQFVSLRNEPRFQAILKRLGYTTLP